MATDAWSKRRSSGAGPAPLGFEFSDNLSMSSPRLGLQRTTLGYSDAWELPMPLSAIFHPCQKD